MTTATAAPPRERGIPMDTASVDATLNNRKWQTRRVVKHQPPPQFPVGWVEGNAAFWSAVSAGDFPMWERFVTCPYGQAGDRLWVRETFRHFFKGEMQASCLYLADAGTDRWRQAPSADYARRTWGPFKSPRFMPRWASRLTLELTAVRVERLHAIPCHEIRAEGVRCPEHDFPGGFCTSECPTLRQAFAERWDALNAKRGYAYATNPWVWVLEYRRVQP